jgi:tRNA-splicing ligase RtcB (3'-phosphate/5'-hydroxy nucleic acid ligase)
MKKATNFALDADEQTLRQFKECYDQPYVTKAALMPDAHSGYVAPIGSVLVTKDYVVPAWVGFDVGCGVTAIQLKGKNILKKIKENKEEIYKEVKKTIPMGLGKLSHPQRIHRETIEEFRNLLKKLENAKIEEDIFKFIKNKGASNLGSLGEGNHFIEMGEFEEEAW